MVLVSKLHNTDISVSYDQYDDHHKLEQTQNSLKSVVFLNHTQFLGEFPLPKISTKGYPSFYFFLLKKSSINNFTFQRKRI